LQLPAAASYVLERVIQEARMIRGIKFVGIPVRNQDVSLKLFTEALGFQVVTDQPFSEKQRCIVLLIPGAESGLR
jgi:hypothetical protein